MDVAGPRLGGQAVAFSIRWRQRVTAGGLEVAVVGDPLPIDHGRLAVRRRPDCYVNNRRPEDQPSPNPAPLGAAGRETPFQAWRKR